MGATLRLKRGTQAQIAGSTLMAYEPAFTTDTSCLYIFDGSIKVMIGKVFLGTHAERPAYGVAGRLYYETDNYELFLDTGSSWTVVGVKSHTNLTDIGTNSHTAIDNFISSKASASGIASLDGSSLVVQNPANATATKTASKIPIADGNGYLNSWIQTGSASGTICAGDDSRLGDTRLPPDNGITLAKIAHGSERGSVFVYNGTDFAPTELLHGSAGDFLQSAGHGADVAWSSTIDGGLVT